MTRLLLEGPSERLRRSVGAWFGAGVGRRRVARASSTCVAGLAVPGHRRGQ